VSPNGPVILDVCVCVEFGISERFCVTDAVRSRIFGILYVILNV
jgi:hypothetical protein